MIVLHLSDTHFGKPHRPVAAAAAAKLARQHRPAAVVVSGDFTQRAKAREFQSAREFLAALAPAPVVLVPGNHDVPLYRFWERLAAPWARYRRLAAVHRPHAPAALDAGGARVLRRLAFGASRTQAPAPLDTVLDVPGEGGSAGARFVALCSAAPRTAVVNGRLTRTQLRRADVAFAQAPPGACRVLVVHHNLVRTGHGGPSPMRGACRVLDRLPHWKTDLVLCGHVHRTWLTETATASPVPLVHAGTASSSRGRAPEEGRNSLNLLRIGRSGIDVTPYLFSENDGRFLPTEARRYERRRR